MDKSELRKIMLQKRMDLPLAYKQSLDQKIAESVHFLYDQYDSIAIYCSFKQEVDTYGLMEHWFWDKKKIFCPKIINGEMVFIQINSFEDLATGHFGVLEPTGDKIVSKSEIDLIFVPLLAYDDHCHRLGYGKGYYDRYLSDYKGLKIGLAYTMQNTETVFAGSQDVALDGIVTEKVFP